MHLSCYSFRIPRIPGKMFPGPALRTDAAMAPRDDETLVFARRTNYYAQGALKTLSPGEMTQNMETSSDAASRSLEFMASPSVSSTNTCISYPIFTFIPIAYCQTPMR